MLVWSILVVREHLAVTFRLLFEDVCATVDDLRCFCGIFSKAQFPSITKFAASFYLRLYTFLYDMPIKITGRDSGVSQSSTRAWDALTPSLSEWLLEATASMGFEKMTPVQAAAIPLLLGYKDLVVEAVTGSGKTMAFLIPLVERLLRLEEPIRKQHVGAIVLSPTRELATQTYKVLISLLAFHGPSAAEGRFQPAVPDPEADSNEEEPIWPSDTPKVVPQLVLGGAANNREDVAIFLKKSPNVLIGTPGRLAKLLCSPYVHTPQSTFDLLVLDEADRLLDLGFKDDLSYILNTLPKQRRTSLFSASVSEAVDQLIRVGLRNPVKISVKVAGINGSQAITPASLRMNYIITPAQYKMYALNQLLLMQEPRPQRTVVYLSTCAAVDYFQHVISEESVLPKGMVLIPLHGKHEPKVRERNFAKFFESSSPTVLLTTDVAARGLDIPEVDLVVQVDPPSDPKVFIHRCGRAGRAGRRGLAVVFLEPHEKDYISFMKVRKTPIDEYEDWFINEESSGQQMDATALRDKMRKIVLRDHGIHDKALKAFVSWVQSYSKHQASSIFRVSRLNWAELINGWALLKLPKMPEAKNIDRTTLGEPEVDWDNYAYKDKVKERRHQQEVEMLRYMEEKSKPPVYKDISGIIKQAEAELAKKKREPEKAWSEKIERKEAREVKRQKRGAKREYERTTKMTNNEKEQQAETQRMIAEVKQQIEQNPDAFEGFD